MEVERLDDALGHPRFAVSDPKTETPVVVWHVSGRFVCMNCEDHCPHVSAVLASGRRR